MKSKIHILKNERRVSMRIDIYFDEFIKSFSPKYDKDLRKTAKTLLKGNKEYCLPQRPGFEESEYLGDNIRDSVKMLPRGKDSAIKVYKRLVAFLRKKGIDISVSFPPIPIDSSFERQMFIAKYLQGEDAQIGDLERKLWVSNRTIDQDLQRLYRGSEDPIQVCGRPFFIPDSNRVKGRIRSASTAHPLFLTENLTQVIIMLKGLRIMAETPLYTSYAEASAADIWQQLSDYAKKRIHFVLSELLPDDLEWYENLEKKNESFFSERQCSVNGNVLLDCLKNEKTFFIEYREDDGRTVFYRDCRIQPQSFRPDLDSLSVECSEGAKALAFSRVLRSAYSIEELLAD